MNRIQEKRTAQRRRHNAQRIKQRWIRRFRQTWDARMMRIFQSPYYRGDMVLPSEDRRLIGLWSASHALCSCAMCGNPRHHFGERTIQELRSDAELNEELKHMPL